MRPRSLFDHMDSGGWRTCPRASPLQCHTPDRCRLPRGIETKGGEIKAWRDGMLAADTRPPLLFLPNLIKAAVSTCLVPALCPSRQEGNSQASLFVFLFCFFPIFKRFVSWEPHGSRSRKQRKKKLRPCLTGESSAA